MKAAVVTAAGKAPEYLDFPEPEAGEGLQIVDLVAAAIHPVVRAKASGKHYSSTGQYPLVPGVDAVARTADGTLVYTGEIEAPWGTYAERMAVAMALPLPDGADPVAIAAGVNPGMSSWMPMTAHIDEHGTPDTVMIIGVTGAAGGLAVQNAQALGVRRIIGVGRGTDDLKRVAALGADTIELGDGDGDSDSDSDGRGRRRFRGRFQAGQRRPRLGAETVEIADDSDADAAAIAAAFNGKAPELVVDFLWGSAAESAFHALASVPGNDATSYVEIGSVISEQAAVPASLLRSRPFRLSGSGIGSFDMRRYFTQVAAYVQLITDGKVDVNAQAYPLSQISQAWAAGAGPRPVLVAD